MDRWHEDKVPLASPLVSEKVSRERTDWQTGQWHGPIETAAGAGGWTYARTVDSIARRDLPVPAPEPIP